MQLGAFSISLAVKNLAVSREFYEKLGFSVFGGAQDQRWLIMRNDATVIGLFEGMFDKNILTFNPGWDSDAKPLKDFTDIRDIQQQLRSAGIILSQQLEEDTKGPGHILVKDPDGNEILIDQHVDRPPSGGPG